MKKIIAGLFAGLILAAGAQALAYACEDGACTLPEREDKAYCYDNSSAYCYGDRAPQARRLRLLTRSAERTKKRFYVERLTLSNIEPFFYIYNNKLSASPIRRCPS